MHGSLACIALAAVQGVGSDASPAPASLRWQLEPGEVLRYRVTREQGLQFDAGSSHRKGSLITQETFRVTVQEVAGDGTARVEVTFEALIGTFDHELFDVHFDSTKDVATGSEVEPVFADHAARLGRSRNLSIAPVGTCSAADAAKEPEDAQGDAKDDPTDWTGMFPEAALLAQVSAAPDSAWGSRQPFESRMHIERGLAAWPVTATCSATAGQAVKTLGLECSTYELDARFALATGEREVADGLALGHILEEPGKGRGTLLFARSEGVLVRFEIEGSTTARIALERGQRATRSSPRIKTHNRVLVELLERRPPPG